MLHDVDIDTVHLVQFERVDAAPVGPLIHQRRIPTIGRVFRQNDELWVGGDDRFVCDLWIATATGIVVEDIDSIGVLQEFIAKGTAAKDIRFSRCANARCHLAENGGQPGTSRDTSSEALLHGGRRCPGSSLLLREGS